ncbi:MAG: class I SAM-dependent methyltransferase [Nitrospinota bacterium]|nr:class I SAM-dependent methyltransferase [Nitrospinota bacterium]
MIDNFHVSEEYANSRRSSELNLQDAAWERSARILEKIKNRFPGKRDITILDMGCGSGYFLRFARQHGFENLTGVEIDAEASRYVNEELGITCHNRFLDDIGFPDNRFDAIILDQVLEHAEEPKVLLTSLQRIIHPEGLIYIGVPNIDSAIIKILGKNHRHFNGWGHLNYFTVQSLDRITEATGFEKIESYTLWEELTPAVLYCAFRHPEVYDPDPFSRFSGEIPSAIDRLDADEGGASAKNRPVISFAKKFILRSLLPIDRVCKFLTNLFNKGAYIEYFGSAKAQ